MSLEIQVMSEMKDAMKAKNEALLRGLRAIKAEIIKAKTEPGANGEISADTEIKLLQKLVKSRKDSLEIYQKQNRPDLAVKESEEIAVIEKFLPAQMSAEELTEVITSIIAAVGATGPQDMGKVMGELKKAYNGQMDFAQAGALVKARLAG